MKQLTSDGNTMKTYTIKQPIFELHEQEGWYGKRWYGKRWYADNIESYFYIYYDSNNPLPYLIRYSFNDYCDEDGERFKTLDEAKEYLIVEFNEYVARNLDEVE